MGDKPFSARLRDMFAKVGFCDSTEDLARKPAIIDALVARAKIYADMQDHYPQNPPYADRLRQVLNTAYTSTLEKLLEKDIVVCLDQRLSGMKSGFFDSEIVAAFYNIDGRQTLSLYDDGTDKTYFLQRGLLDYADDALDDLASEVLSRKGGAPVLSVGITRYNAATKTTVFDWEDGRHYAGEIRKNPWLKNPPLRDKPAKPGPKPRNP